MSELNITDQDPCLHMLLGGHKKPITSISFNPNDKQFASSSEDNIMIWNNMNTSKSIRGSYCFSGHTDVVTCLEYSLDGKIIASCSKDNTVRFWIPTIRGGCTDFTAHTSAVNTVSFSPDNTKIITGSNDKSVKLWDVETRQFISSYLGHNNWVRSAKFSPDGNMIVSCSDDRTVRIWDTKSGQIIHVFTSAKGSPNYISLHANNNTIAVAMNSGSVRVYDIRDRKLQQHYVVHDETTCVDWHPRANYLLSCGKDMKLRIIDVMEGRPLYTLSGHEGGINTCRFSVNGDYLASGGVDKQVMVWKTNFITSS